MKISFVKAMKTPFTGYQWQKKLGIAALLFIPALIASLAFGEKNPLVSLLSFLASLLISGYAVSSAHNEIKNIQPILPEWNFKEAFVNALKAWAIAIVYSLIIVIPVSIIAVITAMQKSFIIILLAIPIALIYFIFTSISATLLYEELNLAKTDALNFKRIIKIFKAGYSDYLIALIFSFLAGIIFGIPASIMSEILNLLTFTSVSSFIVTISQVLAMLVSANLIAQAFKSVDEKIKANDISNEQIHLIEE